MLIYKSGDITVRTVEVKDIPLMAIWLSDPEVLQYYEGRDNPFDEAAVQRKFIGDEKVTRCMVEYKAAPIGYIQFYTIEAKERQEYGYSDGGELIYGTDQFIGEAAYWNKGIGTLIVKSMLEYLTAQRSAEKVVMDPQCWNLRAIACYEKCGLIKKKLLPKHELHEGEVRDCWLMEYVRRPK